MTAPVDVARAIDVAKSILSMIHHQRCDCEKCILARAVIAMAEVVQAAEGVRPLVEWADSQDGKRDLLDPWEVRLVEALDRLRRIAEGGK